MFSSSTLFTLLPFVLSVAGHGMVKNVQIGNGKKYPGSAGPGADPSNSPVRAVTGPDPVKDFSSSDFACGTGSPKPAPIMATANAGDKVQTWWQGGTGINWFHDVGPIMTYMAACDGDCASFTPSKSTKWFKISEEGLPSGDKLGASSSLWAQAKTNDGSPVSVTIPSGLPDGNYLFRQEMVALQLGQTSGGAEFYPNCIQMKVGKGGTAKVNAGPTTSFPGAYKASDPGILVDVYTPAGPYKFPGPAVANIASGSSGSSDSSGDDSGSDNSGSDSSSSAAAPSGTAPANAGSDPSASSSPTATDASSAPASTSTKTCKSKRSMRKVRKSSLSAHQKRRMDASH